MKTVKTKVRLDVEAVNDMPPRDVVLQGIEDAIGESRYQIVNGDQNYWQNESMTLVIELSPTIGDAGVFALCEVLWHDCVADEVQMELNDEGNRIVRVWWD